MARILIVDDSPSQLMSIRRIVQLGHEALTAEWRRRCRSRQARDSRLGADGRVDHQPQWLSSHPRNHPQAHRKHISGDLGDHQDQRRSRVGYAPRRQGLHHQAVQRNRTGQFDQSVSWQPGRSQVVFKPQSKPHISPSPLHTGSALKRAANHQTHRATWHRRLVACAFGAKISNSTI